MNLNGKVCVVTGAAGVLCSAMVEALCEAGAKVALIGRTQEKLEKLAQNLSDKGYSDTLVTPANVLSKEELTGVRQKINDTWGGVDLLVNGAGGNDPKGTSAAEYLEGKREEDKERGFFGLDAEGFDSVFNLNFKGSFLPSQVFAEDMVEKGSGNIINISSMSALLPLTKVGAYSAAKAAVDNFTRWLAVHFSKSGIRVNAIAPGFFVSDQNRFLLYEKDGKTLTARGQKIIDNTPMAEFGNAEDLKGAMVYLASDASRFITGVVLPVDGGFSAYSGV